jgi:small subunit ribosomal protein S16
MVKIRLRRMGAKKQPSYRVVIADARAPRDGKYIEAIGFYNPRTEPETATVKEERALHWLSVGAQPTEAVARLLEKQGTIARFTRLKAGEPLETLLAEAEAAAEARPVPSPATRPVKAAAAEKAKEKAAEKPAEKAEQTKGEGEEEAEA